MSQRLNQFAVGASIVLCLITSVIWIRSYWRSDAIVYQGPGGHRAVQWMAGVLMFGTDNVGVSNRSFGLESWHVVGGESQIQISSGIMSSLGFGHERSETATSSLPARMLESFPTIPPPTIIAQRFWVPLWLLVACFLIVPVRAGMIRLHRRRRRRNMQCVTCGYDVRASPERCPECGTATAPGRPIVA